MNIHDLGLLMAGWQTGIQPFLSLPPSPQAHPDGPQAPWHHCSSHWHQCPFQCLLPVVSTDSLHGYSTCIQSCAQFLVYAAQKPARRFTHTLHSPLLKHSTCTNSDKHSASRPFSNTFSFLAITVLENILEELLNYSADGTQNSRQTWKKYIWWEQATG